MRRARIVLVAGLLMLVIASLARSHSHPAGLRADPAFGVEASGHVPAPVMSTLHHACFDCHSEETRWPWYSSVPVASWLIERDVTEGRGQLNFSRWTQYNNFDRADLLDKACELATKREMPLWQYRLAHGEARLNETEVTALCAWTQREAKRLVGDGS